MKENIKNEIFESHEDFIDKIINYNKNLKEYIVLVYDNKKEDKKIKKKIDSLKFSLFIPLICLLLSFTGIFCLFKYSSFINGIWFFISICIDIVFVLTTFVFFSIYFDEENQRKMILSKVFENIKEDAQIEESDLVALKDLLTENKMIELLRIRNKNILITDIEMLIKQYESDFKTWKATRIYRNI